MCYIKSVLGSPTMPSSASLSLHRYHFDMPPSTSTQTLQWGTELAPGTRKPLITFLKDGDGQLSGVQSSVDIHPQSFMHKTIDAFQLLNDERGEIKEYQSRFDTIINDCLAETANGDWRIDVTDSVDEFQKRIDCGRGFPVLWTDNPTEKNLTKEGAKILATPTMSCLPNTKTQTVDVLVNRSISRHSGVAETVRSIANLNRKKGRHGFLTDFSNRLKAMKADTEGPRWKISRVPEYDAIRHEKLRKIPAWFAPISADNWGIRFSKKEAESYRGSGSVATNIQTSVKSIGPKFAGTTLPGQQEIPDHWDEVGAGQAFSTQHPEASLESPTKAASIALPNTDEYAFAQSAPHDPEVFMTDHWSSDEEV